MVKKKQKQNIPHKQQERHFASMVTSHRCFFNKEKETKFLKQQIIK